MTRVSLARSWASFAWAFLAVVLSIGAWSVSTPLGAAPDEPSHVFEATAIVRGQFTPPTFEVVVDGVRHGRLGVVLIPRWVSDISPACFLRRPNTPAGCAPQVGTDTRNTIAFTQFSNYLPGAQAGAAGTRVPLTVPASTVTNGEKTGRAN